MRRAHLPWPVIAAMYRAACAPRIFVRPGATLTLSWTGTVEIHAAHGDRPTIVVECGPNGENPGTLVLENLNLPRKPYTPPTITCLTHDDPLVRATLRDLCTCDAEPGCATLDHDMDCPLFGMASKPVRA